MLTAHLMNHDEIEKQGFRGRSTLLKKVARWGPYQSVFYRTDLYKHGMKVNWLTNELLTVIQTERIQDVDYHPDKARALSLVHDDPEIITGDHLLGEKMQMSPKELEKLDAEESRAIETLSTVWPETVYGFNYSQLLKEAMKKDTPFAQLVSFADKLDALCESLHEIHAGNRSFYNGFNGTRPPLNGSTLATLRIRYNYLEPILLCDHPFLTPLSAIDPQQILKSGKPHTNRSVMKNTGIPHYDLWKEILIKNGGQEAIGWLTNKKE
jgi:5'-deoxynucleotidase YfbR-like HD superfamily hydrolase